MFKLMKLFQIMVHRPDYLSTVSRPMDLQTIKKHVDSGVLTSTRDVRAFLGLLGPRSHGTFACPPLAPFFPCRRTCEKQNRDYLTFLASFHGVAPPTHTQSPYCAWQ